MTASAIIQDNAARYWAIRRKGERLATAFAILPSETFARGDLLKPVAIGQGLGITRSVPYGAGARRKLDIYRPTAAQALPVIVFFYGGSWQGGSKTVYRFVATSLARRGYVTIVPDYRIYPEVAYPGFVEDGALAVRWAKDNAARLGGDARRIFVMGHSAGAYIAAMLALDSRWLGAVGLSSNRDIAGLIGIAGPYDFLPLREGTLKTIFGGNDPETQPISHVSPGAAPTLLLTGVTDGVVDPDNSARLAAKLRGAGNQAAVISYRWVGHLAIIAAFSPLLRLFAPVLRDVDAFIRSPGDIPC